jgi:cytochrome c oxidase assembly protein subunit 11
MFAKSTRLNSNMKYYINSTSFSKYITTQKTQFKILNNNNLNNLLINLKPSFCNNSKRFNSTFRNRNSNNSNNGNNYRNNNSGSNSSSGDRIETREEMNSKLGYYFSAIAIFVFGLSYASVPLYKVFCQMTGFGGTTQVADELKATNVKPVPGGKVIRVDFASSVHDTMPWKFTPTQRNVRVVPGETALAFYTVKNPADRAITGVATYNVFPPKAGLYFNKIQCFCFEEQRLGSKEEIDMPVFFFIDPEICDDPAMENVHTILLSYTFFKTGEEEPEVQNIEINKTLIIDEKRSI